MTRRIFLHRVHWSGLLPFILLIVGPVLSHLGWGWSSVAMALCPVFWIGRVASRNGLGGCIRVRASWVSLTLLYRRRPLRLSSMIG